MILTLRFAWMSRCGAMTIERLRFGKRDRRQWLDALEMIAIRGLAVELECFVADGVTHAATKAVRLVRASASGKARPLAGAGDG